MEFGLKESFRIDDGSLDGLSPQQCFTLGGEWQMFYDRLESGEEYYMLIHTDNQNRFEKMLEDRDRPYKVRISCDDWREIDVAEASS